MKHFSLAPVLFFFVAVVISHPAIAQISIPATPPSFALEQLKSDVPVEILRTVDTKKLLEEDKILDTIKDIPWRFGDNIMVDIHPGNAGIWDVLDNGDKLWRVALYSQGAYTLNLTFNQYELPPGAQLFVYNQEKSMVLGAFTEYNNQDDGYFATTLVEGDYVIVEYYEPAEASFEGTLNLEMVTHAYRDPYEFAKSFGSSGSCNLNVACEEADNWQQQVRSTALMVTGGNGFCTGALINNTQNDGTPLFLSANHCYRNPSTVVLWFNWQSESCENPPSSPPYNSMSGATQRARHAASDFWLMELNQPVPDEFNPFYAGWNRTLEDTLDEFIIGVHHPSGDIKKFSYAEEGVQQANYLQPPNSGNTHWRIVWSGGTTTEPGSSGSPLFDSQGRIIGQLHGGYAACGNTQPDWYGRLGVSWTGGGSTASRLSDWLDPSGNDVMGIPGFDPLFSGINNPENFVAYATSASDILLEWQLNDSLDNVMVAFSQEDTFGTPEGPYTLGEEIAGGGQVIYLGNDEEFLHQNLMAHQNYHYNIWSYSGDLMYSVGTVTSATTPCGSVDTFPVFEGFNDDEIPGCWTQQSEEGEVQWLVGVGNDDGYPYDSFEGERNVYFKTNSVPEIGSITKLISPLMDLSAWENAELSFYFTNPASQANQDILRVYYRTSTTEEWIELDTYGANQFNWTQAIIPLPELSSKLQIAFEGEGYRGRGISLDQVEIFASSDTQLPVPANVTLELLNGNQPQLQWEINSEDNQENLAIDGFNIYRNENLIHEGNDPLQTSFTDEVLSIGSYNYYLQSRSGETLLSAPSNEVTANIEATGNENELTIVITGQGETSLPEGEYLYEQGSEITVVATPDEHWYFSHWEVNGEEVGSETSIDLTLDTQTVLHAIFNIEQYQVTLQAEPADAAGTLSGEGIYTYGTIASLSAEPVPGYIFLHWQNENHILSTNPNLPLTVTGDQNLTAWFAEHTYELELEVYPPDAGYASGAGTYDANSEVEVMAEPEPGWVFSHWTLVLNLEEEEVSNEAIYSFTLSDNMLLVAHFEPFSPALDISVEGNGTTMPEPGTHVFEYGEELVFTAIPDEGWEFAKWVVNGEDYTVSQFMIYIEENTTALATFEPATGIDDNNPEPAIRLYPNPASTEINIELPGNGEWKISLLNLTGQVLKTLNTGSHARVSLVGLPKGLYLLKAEREGSVLHKRFIAE